MLKKKVLLFLFFISGILFSNGQDKPVNIVGCVGFSYGIQSISIPPFMNKLSLGINYAVKSKTSLYILPGFTVGMAPVGYYHIETGIKYHFITFDYSINWLGQDKKWYKNQNFNVGLQFKLVKEINFWLKYGRSFQKSEYNISKTNQWGGNNIEAKIMFLIF